MLHRGYILLSYCISSAEHRRRNYIQSRNKFDWLGNEPIQKVQLQKWRTYLCWLHCKLTRSFGLLEAIKQTWIGGQTDRNSLDSTCKQDKSPWIKHFWTLLWNTKHEAVKLCYGLPVEGKKFISSKQRRWRIIWLTFVQLPRANQSMHYFPYCSLAYWKIKRSVKRRDKPDLCLSYRILKENKDWKSRTTIWYETLPFA